MGNLNKQTHKLRFSYTDMERALDSFVNKIESEKINYDCVVGIARGGLVPAVRLSHRLGVPLDYITWSTRDQNQRNEQDVYRMISKLNDGKRIVLVEDIIDHGTTINEIFSLIDKDLLSNIDLAVLINNVDVDIVPKYTSISISRSIDNAWYEFWWENKKRDEIRFLQTCW